MNCPDFARIIDYCDARLAISFARPIEAHVALGCVDCVETIDWYRRVRQVAADDDSIEPPPWIFKRAVRIFDTQQEKAPSLAGKLIAAFVFDSVRRPTLAMARATALEGRQLMYEAGDYSIDLHVDLQNESQFDLSGQILRSGELMFESVAGISIALRKMSKTILSTRTNNRGEFDLSNIDRGTYDLRIHAGDLQITVTGLEIG